MKKTVLFFVVILSLSQTQKVHAQAGVTEGLLTSILAYLKVDQQANTILELAAYAEQITHLVTQIEQTRLLVEDSLENFKRLEDVENFEDFMRWNNRQLYLERQVENKFNGIGINVGGKKYGVRDAMDIPEALINETKENWSGEFTEAQRRRMYVKLGMTPANYTYVKTWQGRIENAVEKMAVMTEVLNEENMATAEEEASDMAVVQGTGKIGATKQWQIEMRALYRQNDQLKNLNAQMAEANNLKAAEVMLEQEGRLPRDISVGTDFDKVNSNFDL